ncbi:MAG TPA: SxtJ family membrane protein [Chthoniobacterales bacterium]|nr:SxtJ family membrane protein [Chthoniobacterales bacterium]
MWWINQEYEELDRTPGALRRFGRTVGAAFFLLGALLVWRSHAAGWPISGFGLVILLGAWRAPGTLRYFHRVWMTFALFLGWIMTGLILTVVFFTVVAPLGLLQKLLGKSALDLNFPSDQRTYWQPRDGQPTPSDYERQF